MNKGDKANSTRKQAERRILTDMRTILQRVSVEKQTETESETVDKSHVFSIVNHFTALKRAVKIKH